MEKAMMSYPPKKNRRPEELPVLRLEVEDANAVKVFDPNTIAMWIFEHGEKSLVPIEPAGIVKYRSCDFELCLKPEVLARLVLIDLSPSEYFELRNQFGMAHEWHDDFYDEATGIALQPHRRSAP
jgi:hypothetical protein